MRNSYSDSHFQIWKNRIEVHIKKVLDDVLLDDLPDEPYRIWFEETHMTPLEVSNKILIRNGFSTI